MIVIDAGRFGVPRSFYFAIYSGVFVCDGSSRPNNPVGVIK